MWTEPFGCGYILLGLMFSNYSKGSLTTKVCGYICLFVGAVFVLNAFGNK